MSAIFELSLPSETLTPDEVTDISGCKRANDQVEWLKRNGWLFILNRAGMPIIGRLYARLKLAGINPALLAAPAGEGGWQPDFSKVQ
ncbi:DUF4224 domain-containing protein [Massilia sp. YIM B02443]|uniref:DUF4224 domain-containing protein n=1 Tax=Massilia sp. YIM B02443 TaxID=3050127 RepID=UPI0025B72FAD|nr:DUF4224 domain-containing protein [Massilia sp. YIM B02443]MDN4038687.1 DUF4224 domain-containing protein [Massilia sp. YIM B02443]